jgi:hypothetical protein
MCRLVEKIPARHVSGVHATSRLSSANVEDTWTVRELPVLQAVVAAFEDPDRYVLPLQELIQLCGLPERDVPSLPSCREAPAPQLKF